jgi:hypothetical protein
LRLKALYSACYFFDIGLFAPKASLLAFYFHLFPDAYRPQRIALYIITAYISAAFLVTACMDTFGCLPISDNWSMTAKACTVWNSFTVYYVNFGLNLSSDILVFGLPFTLLKKIRIDTRAKYALLATFTLGGVTISVSILRFVWVDIVYNFFPTVTWCSAEMCASIVVVCLPSLKSLLRDGTGGSGYDYRYGSRSPGPGAVTYGQGVIAADLVDSTERELYPVGQPDSKDAFFHNPTRRLSDSEYSGIAI